MKLKILLRVVNAIILVVLYKVGGIDWVIVYGLIVVIADLDAIADAIENKRKRECE